MPLNNDKSSLQKSPPPLLPAQSGYIDYGPSFTEQFLLRIVPSIELDSTARELCTQSRSWDKCNIFKLIIKVDTLTAAALGLSTIFSRKSIPVARTMWFSVSIFVVDSMRNRGATLEHKVWSLQKVLIKQHEDLNLKNHDAFLVFASTFFDVDPNSLLVPLLILFPSFVSVLAIKTSSANSYAGKVVS
ncbi:hypothetical protein ARMSODRAFT_1016892 [Armillaria solidipes]|uniref:Uncharacterized protein n=1 Tax=Armillaria solidipes TaxID=1076256 RepID=A0A2H3C9E3_9AGAR|nr:hypothetical protein ARMSODRAFT_1016892 [Armillaria solidipes]